jgi:hypothetical protein
MSELSLLPFARDGAWEHEGQSRREARLAFSEFLAAQQVLREALVARRAQADLPHAERRSVSAELSRRNFFSHATVLFCCVAIESFMNHYGVRRFGNAFSEHERLGIHAKARLLLKHTSGAVPAKDDVLFTCLSRLFDRRNRLAHPKTHEYEEGVEPPELETWTVAAQECVEDMDAVFKRFGELDPDAGQLAAAF